MLHTLSIKNFVLVDSLDLQLHEGLSIVSGETGAGKSILVDALGLLLGDRAGSDVVRAGEEEAEISAAFDLTPTVSAWLEERKLNGNPDDCLLRRIINRNGRSRAYINDHLVTVQNLREVGELLVDIHSQHAHQTLLKTDAQRDLLDNRQEQNQALQQTATAYQNWKKSQDALLRLGGNAAERAARIEVLRYQVKELEALGLDDNGIAALDEEHQRLAHAGQLLESVQNALDLLDGDNLAALNGLHRAAQNISSVQEHDPSLQAPLEMLENAAIQVEEACHELRRYSENLDIDPQRLQYVEQRIATLQDMARKHQTQATELPDRLRQLSTQLDELSHYEERAAALESEVQETLQTYRKSAQALYQQRSVTAKELSAQIEERMQSLGMPKGRFSIQISHHPDAPPALKGTDRVEFQVCMNPGQPLKPLHKVASGGELSRISLAVQVITAQSSTVSSLVFDEVDVGVGGGVAEIVGQQLQALGKQRQVLCITHLPQVAAYGRQHLQVQKITENNNTCSRIQQLSPQQREQELARMLGGLKITEQTLAHAREMLIKD